MRDPMTGETIATDLEDALRTRGAESVVVVGLATDYCVKATALDAVRLGFRTVVLPETAIRIRKGADGEDGYSGFTMRDPMTGETIATNLEDTLRARGAESVVVVGLATDYCVKATALDAIRLGFRTLVLPGAIAAVDLEQGDGDRALAELRAAGVELERTVA